MKIKCDKCNAIATWIYMPSDGDGQCCDNCVPRGCSCNFKYSDKLDADGCPALIVDDHGNPVEETDEQGRLYPCCEWDYDPYGHDEFDEYDMFKFFQHEWRGSNVG